MGKVCVVSCICNGETEIMIVYKCNEEREGRVCNGETYRERESEGERENEDNISVMKKEKGDCVMEIDKKE
jgi:hypothetical protein